MITGIIVVFVLLVLLWLFSRTRLFKQEFENAKRDRANRKLGYGPSFMEGLKRVAREARDDSELTQIIRGELRHLGVPMRSSFDVVDREINIRGTILIATDLIELARTNQLTALYLVHQESIIFGLLCNAQGKMQIYTRPSA